jgi:hypothetical protein
MHFRKFYYFQLDFLIKIHNLALTMKHILIHNQSIHFPFQNNFFIHKLTYFFSSSMNE